jgi:hypothetical protein
MGKAFLPIVLLGITPFLQNRIANAGKVKKPESAISGLPLLPLAAHGIIPAMKQEVKFQAAAALAAAQALGLLYPPATA